MPNWLSYDPKLRTVSKWVLSFIWQAYHKIVKNLFPLHICRPNDHTREISYFAPTIFLLMFFPLFSKVFPDILKIYELPKIYNKIPKYWQTLVLTIIILQANSMSQLHLAFDFINLTLLTLSKMCPRVAKNSFGIKF